MLSLAGTRGYLDEKTKVKERTFFTGQQSYRTIVPYDFLWKRKN